MDESVLSSPLEGNLKNLIIEKFEEWQKALKSFLDYTDVIKGLEEQRSRALIGYAEPTFGLPEKLQNWSKSRSSASQDFCKVFTQDFRPKLAKELADLQEEQRDALQSLRGAFNSCKASGTAILKDSNYLLNYFNNGGLSAAKVPSVDPWLKELSIRHHSAIYLEHKAEYLEALFRVYCQVRHLNSELLHKLDVFSDEFYALMDRFGIAIDNSYKNGQLDSDFPVDLMSPPHTTTTAPIWQQVLKAYSLDYDWKLECPPLDGFLSTLFTQMKSLGADELIISTNSSNLPKLFPDSGLRFGFLQNRTSGLLSRSWNANFAILQPITGFVHFFKVNPSNNNNNNSNSSSKIEGHLLVPTIGGDYSKSSLHDLNTLALQHFLQSSHHPASISAQILSPFLSIPISKDSKIAASDPETFSFFIKSPGCEKAHLRAFCEEDFVDWVVFFNEAAGKTVKKASKHASPKSSDKDEEIDGKTDDNNYNNNFTYEYENDHFESSTPAAATSATTIDESPPSSNSSRSPTAPTNSFAPPIVDIENPWN